MSTDAEELIRLRRAFTATFPCDTPSVGCPTAERIWNGSRGDLTPGELHELMLHIAGCPVCTESWRLAEEIEGSTTVEMPVRRRPSSWQGRIRFAATAAAAAAVLGLGSLVYDGQAPRPVLRAPDSHELRLLSEGPLTREDCLLRWQGPEKADYYELRVSSAADPMNLRVDESDLEETTYRIPPQALAGLPPDSELQIHLVALHSVEGQLDAATFQVVVR